MKTVLVDLNENELSRVIYALRHYIDKAESQMSELLSGSDHGALIAKEEIRYLKSLEDKLASMCVGMPLR